MSRLAIRAAPYALRLACGELSESGTSKELLAAALNEQTALARARLVQIQTVFRTHNRSGSTVASKLRRRRPYRHASAA